MVKGGGGGGGSSQLLLQLDLFIISTIVTLKENWIFHISLNQFRHENDIERKIINQNWKIVDNNCWDFELWAGDAILQLYIIYGRGDLVKIWGGGASWAFPWKLCCVPTCIYHLRRQRFHFTPLAKIIYVSNGTEKLAYILLVPKCLTLPPLFIFFSLIKLKVILSKQF